MTRHILFVLSALVLLIVGLSELTGATFDVFSLLMGDVESVVIHVVNGG